MSLASGLGLSTTTSPLTARLGALRSLAVAGLVGRNSLGFSADAVAGPAVWGMTSIEYVAEEATYCVGARVPPLVPETRRHAPRVSQRATRVERRGQGRSVSAGDAYVSLRGESRPFPPPPHIEVEDAARRACPTVRVIRPRQSRAGLWPGGRASSGLPRNRRLSSIGVGTGVPLRSVSAGPCALALLRLRGR